VKGITPFLILTFFLILALLGINLGEVPEIMEKAITICLSCMGIG
jgi:hypothetical protein